MTLPPPPKVPTGHAPLRVPGAARRTSSIEVDWPEGRGGPMHLIGRARDIVTSPSGAAILCGEGAFEAMMAADRTIAAIETRPARDVANMVGERPGSHLRKVIDAILPEERRAGTPLHLILDDISGGSLVAPWAWSC